MNVPPSVAPSEQPFVPATKKNGKGLLFGLLGCGGLLAISLIALAVGIPLLQRAEILPQPLFGGSSTPSQTDLDKYRSNPTNINSNSAVVPNNDGAGSKLLSEMQALKQVGSFNQTSVKVVNAKDFFPEADAAVQSGYSDGSQFVVSTTGKFPSNETALENFDIHLKFITKDGATIYSNESKNGVNSAVYKYKDSYFIEVCTQGTCSRNNSRDAKALQSFVKSYSTALDASLKSDSSTPNTATTETETKTISGGIVNDKAVNLVTPTYPAAAKAVRASGTVNVQVTIDTVGNVVSAGATSGHPLLRQSAEQAARASKFKPTVLSGQAVNVTGIITYNFEAQ